MSKSTADNMQSVTSNAVYNAINGLVKETEFVNIGTITMPSSNYYAITTGVPSGKKIIGYNIGSWGSNTDCFSVIIYGRTGAYIVAKSGTVITGFSICFYYI